MDRPTHQNPIVLQKHDSFDSRPLCKRSGGRAVDVLRADVHHHRLIGRRVCSAHNSQSSHPGSSSSSSSPPAATSARCSLLPHSPNMPRRIIVRQ